MAHPLSERSSDLASGISDEGGAQENRGDDRGKSFFDGACLPRGIDGISGARSDDSGSAIGGEAIDPGR